ncbi:MAG: TonB-dependent receptor [Acidobacteriota bacterium]|nr:TonB-dependent receptor [Acidobacteriota bacterium]
MKTVRFLIWTLLLTFSVGTSATFAQATPTAELRGQVTDPNGAAVAGATVTATDNAKGTARTGTTDEDGNYVLLSLLPGVYTVKVDATGFAPNTTNNVELLVGQQLALDVKLTVGTVGVVVDVLQNEEILVDTERTQQSSVITSRQIENLPINRRNFLDFALLTPGVTDADNINDTTDARVAQTPQSGLSFGGNNGRGNSVTVDGSTADTPSGGARDVVSQEAVQEFQVNRNSYNAEFGGSSGGIVNIVSKTGSNDFHGSVFGFFRDKRFDARNAFDFNPNGQSPFNRQQFGGSLGGPIAEDKTFFFVSAEALRQKQTSFINFTDAISRGLRIAPATSTADTNALLNYLSARAPFAPIAAGLRNVLTVPTARTTNLYASTSGQFPFDSNNTLLTGRIDHNFSENDTAFVRVNYANIYGENQAAGALTAVSRGRTIKNPSAGILVSETHTFNPTTVNEARAQFSYYDLNVIANDLTGPEINIDGFGNFGRDIFLPSRSITRAFDFADTVSMVRGNHTIKFGGVLQFSRTGTNSETYTGGSFRFGALPLAAFIPLAARTAIATQIQTEAQTGVITPAQAALLGSTLATATVNSLQAFNANAPQVYQQSFGATTFFGTNTQKYSLFAQDTWKIRPNFTLNYGLRYFLQNEEDPVPLDKNNLQPRIGFSWDLFNNGNTVLRGGAGIFVGQIDTQITNVVNTLASGTAPHNLNIVVATAQTLPGAPANQNSIAIYQTLLAQGVLGVRQPTAADITQFGLSTAPGRPLEARIRLGENYVNPETYQASAAIQQNLGGGFAAELSYLFTRGIHLTRPVDVRRYAITGTSPFTGQPTLQALPPAGSLFPRALDAEYQSVANSFYHAGTLQVTKRFSHNYSINANYTYSKAIDEVTDFNTDYLAQNPFNIREDRGLSAFDQRHRLVFSAVLFSPFENVILRDFVFSPIFIAGSGRPFNLLIGGDTGGLGNNDGRLLNDRPARAARNTGKGDEQYTFDMRLARRFFVQESRYLELTFEAFNLFNTVNYNGVNNVVGTACVENFPTNPNCQNASFVIPINARGIEGRSPIEPLGFTSAAPARQLQFGIRFNF